MLSKLILLVGLGCSIAAAQNGHVNYVIMTDPTWDTYTSNPSAATEAWFNANSWRLETFSPYFDSKLSWYPNAWSYLDSYAIYPGNAVLTTNPEWILKSPTGAQLYIPWGCSGGTCPQFAADIGNPAYVAWWINQAAAMKTTGYKGLWIDDVNMVMNVSDGTGTLTAPIDPRTGSAMTTTAWEGYMASFMQAVRKAFPAWEIVHNVIWGANMPTLTADPNIRAEIAAATYINLERGVVDPGLTGGAGNWSLWNLLLYTDAVHAIGPGVVLDNAAGSLDYGLAAYFLISTGRDSVSSTGMMPNAWYNGFTVNLGSATVGRYNWIQGLYRRDYSGGFVLVNPPQTASQTVALGGTYYTTAGLPVGSATLTAANGAVFVNATAAGAFSLTSTTPTPKVMAGSGSATATITSTALSGFANIPVNLAITGCPANVTCRLSSTALTLPSTAVLTFTTSAGAVPGTYLVTVSGEGGLRSTVIPLVVAGVQDFSLAGGAMSFLPGYYGQANIAVTPINGFTGPVALSLTGCPTGAGCWVPPTLSGSSQAIVITTSGAAAGAYSLTLTGTAGTLTHSVPISVVIQ